MNIVKGKIAIGAGVLTVILVGASACGTDINSGSGRPNQASSAVCANGTLTASGSTAQQNAVAQWSKEYLAKCDGANVNYAGGGSGQGLQQFHQGAVDFAGSDFPITAGEAGGGRCKGGQAINVPMTPGPIALGYNVPGVPPGLNLSASNLAKIFSGKITNWNDPSIARDNPGIALPNLTIQTFHRSDGSGTTYNFTNYLANEAKADWPFPSDQQNWPAQGGQGAKGTQGVAQGVKSTPGGIGYMELSYATKSKIPYAKLSNASGTFVELTQQNAQNFVAAARPVGQGNDLKLSFDYTNTAADAYPNVLVTYELVCQSGNDPAKLPLLKNYLGYAASPQGQQQLLSQGYTPLPPTVQGRVQAAVQSLS